MSKPRIVITETLDAICADWLAERAEVIWTKLDEPDAMLAALREAQGLIVRTYTQVNDALLNHAGQLKVVGRAGVGLDNIDLEACRKRGIPVVYTPDANTQAVVDYVLGLMLDFYRPRTAMVPPVDAGQFHQLRKTEVGEQLDQLTLGIVGFGRIGKKLGRVADALGMKLLVTDLLPEQALRDAVDYPFTFVSHEQLYRESDIVTIHVDGRAENRQMINAQALSHFKANAMFINAARGMLVDAQALADWARAHPQSHVVLDVHDPEPPTQDYPLFGIENVLLLPHLASRTPTAMENMSWVVRDILRVISGEPPVYPAW